MPSSRSSAAVILAAGKGVRMKSDLPKVLHPLMGKPLVTHVANACRKAGIRRVILVIGHQAQKVRETLGPGWEYVEQTAQLGTGHALMIASETLSGFRGDLLVVVGDAPFLTSSLLRRLLDRHRKTHAAATLMTAIMDPPPAYGRIVRDCDGRVIRIVEERDASPQEKKITEVNTSHYCFEAESILPLLNQLDSNNDQGEYYLTDIIGLCVRNGLKVESMTTDDPFSLMGVNSRADLAAAHAILKERILHALMTQGVTILDPPSTYVEPGIKVGPDTILYPGTVLLGRTTVGRGCEIGPQVTLKDARIGDGCKICHSRIENRRIAPDSRIGPFASICGE